MSPDKNARRGVPLVEWRHRGCRCVLLQAYLTPKGWRIELPRVGPDDLVDHALPPSALAVQWSIKRVRRKGAKPETRLLPLRLGDWSSWDFVLVCPHHGPKEIHAVGIGVEQLRSDIEGVIAAGRRQPVARIVPALVT